MVGFLFIWERVGRKGKEHLNELLFIYFLWREGEEKPAKMDCFTGLLWGLQFDGWGMGGMDRK